MTFKSYLGRGLIAALTALVPMSALAQNFPAKPIQIFTAQPDGTADVTARLIAKHANFGQPVIVNNRPQILSAQEVARAAPDGHTILVMGKSFYLAPIFQDTPYDPVKNFAPISKLTSSPNIMVVHPSLPKSVDEIVKLLRSKPGEMNYATGASGGAAHLAAEMFKEMAKVELERVVYSGGGPSMVGVMSNESQISFGTPAMVSSLVESGNLRAVAVTSEGPSAVAPGLPPLAQYLPGFVEASTQGVWAPAGTPKEVVEKINKEIARVLALPEVKETMLRLGSEVAPSTPDAFANEIGTEIDRTKKIMARTSEAEAKKAGK